MTCPICSRLTVTEAVNGFQCQECGAKFELTNATEVYGEYLQRSFVRRETIQFIKAFRNFMYSEEQHTPGLRTSKRLADLLFQAANEDE